MTTLSVGKKAPAFNATDDQGKKIRLADFAGTPVVLYFYPKDNTPGCTQQACDFQSHLARLKKISDATVIGVSKDSIASHQKFKSKFDLAFPLISDEDGSLCEKYGVWVEKKLYGRAYMGIERTTFLIDDKGIIREIWPKVKVKDHVDSVIDSLKKLKSA